MVSFRSNENGAFTKFILALPRDKKQLFLYQFGIYSIILGSLVLFLSLTGGELEVVADQIMFVRRGKLILDGEIPFITAISGQSAPLSYYLWVIPILLSDITGMSYSISFRLFFIAANIITSFLIYSINLIPKQFNECIFFIDLLFLRTINIPPYPMGTFYKVI